MLKASDEFYYKDSGDTTSNINADRDDSADASG